MAPSRVFRLSAAELARFGEEWFPFAVHLLCGLIATARRIEHNAREREALVALGTLAAGLAHEINNPASAAVRSVGALQQSSDDVFASLQRLAGAGIDASQFTALDELRRSIDPSSAPTGVALSDLEESLTDWLEDHSIDRSWTIAPALAAAGVSPAWLDARRLRPVRGGPPGRPRVGGLGRHDDRAHQRGAGLHPPHLRPRLGREVLLPDGPRGRPGGPRRRRPREHPDHARPQAARGRHHRRPRVRRLRPHHHRQPRRAQPGLDEPHRQRRRRHGRRRHPDGADVRRRRATSSSRSATPAPA